MITLIMFLALAGGQGKKPVQHSVPAPKAGDMCNQEGQHYSGKTHNLMCFQHEWLVLDYGVAIGAAPEEWQHCAPETCDGAGLCQQSAVSCYYPPPSSHKICTKPWMTNETMAGVYSDQCWISPDWEVFEYDILQDFFVRRQDDMDLRQEREVKHHMISYADEGGPTGDCGAGYYRATVRNNYPIPLWPEFEYYTLVISTCPTSGEAIHVELKETEDSKRNRLSYKGIDNPADWKAVQPRECIDKAKP